MAKVKSKKSATANQKPAVKRIRSQAITKANIAVAKLQKDAKAEIGRASCRERV